MNFTSNPGRPNMYVPSSGSTDNVYINDVIGNKNDDHTMTENLAGRTHTQYEHTHSISLIYPDNAPAVTLTAGTTSYSMGNITTIVSSGTIPNVFDIHWLDLSNATVAGSYMVRIYQGSSGAETLIGNARVSRGTGTSSVQPVAFMTPHINANTRISAT